ncbi:MAG TPA: ABC transporter substrate-binding protein [Streptosporangiaceae bacterium]|nr:ABC transporter substrate-binding protein [Streptosporangiaceae bacterium]
MRWNRARLAAAAIAVVALAAGCSTSSGSSATGGSSASAGTPKKGGALTIIYQNEVTSLDPTATTTAAGAGSLPYYAIYDALFTLSAGTGAVTPKIGQSLTANSAQTVWTLKLRPGVKFSDGTPYDAAAVEFNWARDKAPTSAVASAAAIIKSMTVVDPTTLQVTLVAPDSSFDRTVAQQLLFIASPTAIKKEGASFGTHPVGAGAFILSSWVRNSQKTFTANPHYYQPGQPYLSKLVISVIPDESQGATALKTGQGNYMYTQDGSIISQLKAAGLQSTITTTPGSPNIAFNNKKAPFDDPSIRKAVMEAINVDQMAKVNGTFVPVSQPFPSGSPYNFGLSWPAYNQANAQQLFNAYAAAHGGPVTFTIQGFQDPVTGKNLSFIQAALGQYKNVKVNITTVAASTAITNVFTGNYQASAWGAPWYTPADLYIYLSPGQQLNVYKFSNPAVTSALASARATGDQSTQNADYKTVVQNMISSVPFFNFGMNQCAGLYPSSVHNVKLFYDGYPFLEDIWVG